MATTLRAQTTTNAPAQSTAPAADYDQIVSDGNARFKTGDYTAAHEDAMKALALDGNRFEGYALESLVSFKGGHAAEAKTFMDLALEKVPASKKPQLEALAATIERVGSPAAAPSAEVSTATQSHPAEIDQLKGDDRLEYETLLAMLSDADKASDLDSRHKMLGDFMDKSAGFLKAHPDLVHLWVARAAVAVELDRGEEGWEAGQKLKALGFENSTDPEIVKVMVELNEKGWLSSNAPKPMPKVNTPRTPDDFLHDLEITDAAEASAFRPLIVAVIADHGGVENILPRTEPEVDDLRAAVASHAPNRQLAMKLKIYFKGSRTPTNWTSWTRAQKRLWKVLTIRQQAIAILSGLL